MLHCLGRLRWVLRFPRTAARHPRTAAAVTLAILAGIGVGFHRYALHQWRAAESAVRDGRVDEARGKLDFCLFIWPQNAEVRLLAARVARLTGDYAAAEAHLNECMKLQHGASEATQLEFLLMRAQTGEEDVVAPALRELVLAGHPESPLILETMARAYMHELRYGPAYECLSIWIERVPGAAKAYHWRGWVVERLNNAKEATKDYRRALDIDPDLTAVRLRLAEMMLADNQPADARPHLERLRTQFPDRADIQARLGQCLLGQNEREEARRLMTAAVEKLPDDPALLLTLGKLDLQDGRAAEAESWLRRALTVDPADTEAQYTLASSLQFQGRQDEAAAMFRRSEQNKVLLERANQLLRDEADHPSTGPDVPTRIGEILIRVGQERLGLYWLDQALIRDPRHEPAHRALAEYYEGKGEQEKAEKHRRQTTASTGSGAGPAGGRP
ncbi:MAG: tetratricopeptide repeat protein [Gemmataceae bacterium]|nr:tetratricopeptide repeat protein [Gemmataceae bacterium]